MIVNAPCVLSLFAGYGGLDIALDEVLNVKPRYVADIEAGPTKVLAFRYPHAPNLGDVTKVTWSALTGVRVVCGGSPCQDISTAGKRAGMHEGTRSNLWVEMRDAIAILRPELVLWENVHAARSADAASELEPCSGCVGGTDDAEPVLRALGRVLGDLAELGFDAEWVSVPAAGVGCAHLRWRVFVVAWPADAPSNPRWVGHRNGRATTDTNDAATDGEWSRSELRQRGPTAAIAAGVGHERRGGAWVGGDGSQDGYLAPLTLLPTPRVSEAEHSGRAVITEGHQRGLAETINLLPTPAVNDMGAGKEISAWDAWTDKMRAAHANGNGHGKSLDIEARRLPTPTTRDTKGANQRGDDTCLTGALLPTPRATDGTKGGPNQRGSSGDLMLPSAVALMPTPSVADAMGGHERRGGKRGDELLLKGLVKSLPTPTVQDARSSGSSQTGTDTHHEGTTLTDATVRQPNRWGDYADSIARAEAAFGPAPEPTETDACHCGSKVKSRRLSCRFDEWLMGLPAGWVTDVPGITHAEALKLCGNGVVPAQAALALRICLARIEAP